MTLTLLKANLCGDRLILQEGAGISPSTLTMITCLFLFCMKQPVNWMMDGGSHAQTRAEEGPSVRTLLPLTDCSILAC